MSYSYHIHITYHIHIIFSYHIHIIFISYQTDPPASQQPAAASQPAQSTYQDSQTPRTPRVVRFRNPGLPDPGKFLRNLQHTVFGPLCSIHQMMGVKVCHRCTVASIKAYPLPFLPHEFPTLVQFPNLLSCLVCGFASMANPHSANIGKWHSGSVKTVIGCILPMCPGGRPTARGVVARGVGIVWIKVTSVLSGGAGGCWLRPKKSISDRNRFDLRSKQNRSRSKRNRQISIRRSKGNQSGSNALGSLIWDHSISGPVYFDLRLGLFPPKIEMYSI